MANDNVEPLKPIIGEMEVRMFMSKPICAKCKRKKGTDHFLEEAEGQVVLGPKQIPMATWTCRLCDYSVQLPPGAFPRLYPRAVSLDDLEPPKSGAVK